MFRRSLAATFAAVALIAVSTPAFAAEPPAPTAHNLELAKRLFTDMHMDRLMAGMMQNMAPAMIAQARKANPSMTDEQAQVIGEAVSESTQAMMVKVIDRVAPLYASTFTEKELQDLVNFYDGPSGQAMLAKLPGLMAHMTPMMTELIPQVQADMLQRICAKLDCTKLNAPPAPKA